MATYALTAETVILKVQRPHRRARFHQGVRRLDNGVMLTPEACNLDDGAPGMVVADPLELDAAAEGQLCRRCFPRTASA